MMSRDMDASRADLSSEGLNIVPDTLLGFSANWMSILLESLAASGASRVVIVENIESLDDVPYENTLIGCSRIQSADWAFDGKGYLLFGVNKPASKEGVFRYYSDHKGVERSNFGRLIHSFGSVASTASIGRGCYFEPGVIISPFANIGFGVTINRAVSIGHHTAIGEYTTINPGCHVAGHCKVGRGVTLGMGTVVFDGVSIGDGTIVGGGSVVTPDIPAGVLAFGSPCKVVRSLSSPA